MNQQQQDSNQQIVPSGNDIDLPAEQFATDRQLMPAPPKKNNKRTSAEVKKLKTDLVGVIDVVHLLISVYFLKNNVFFLKNSVIFT